MTHTLHYSSYISKGLLRYVLFVLAMLSFTLPHSMAQTSLVAEKIVVKATDKPLSEILKSIDQQSKYPLIFNMEQVGKYKSLSVNINAINVTDAVRKALMGTDLTFKLTGNTIVIAPPSEIVAKYGNETNSITFTVVDRQSGKPLVGAVCSVEDYSLNAVANSEGMVTIKNIPIGNVSVKVSYIGYKPFSTTVNVSGNVQIKAPLVFESLKINDVTVVAKQTSFGKSSSLNIGRQAIDHLQALSLGDVLALVPGKIVGTVDDMTGPQQATLRTLFSDKNNSNGLAIIMDGMPISNNADRSENPYNVLGGGIDMRKISTDDIESIEVITGVPSAEYGDLSSGLIVVNRKSGETPLSVRAKVSPSIIQASANKGWSLGKERGVVNASFDYLNSSGDPRNKTEAYDRVNTSFAYSKKIGILQTNTNVSFSGSFDTSKEDPDAVQEGKKDNNKDYSLSISHKGTLRFDRLFSRNLKYNLGFNTSKTDYYTTRYVVNSGGETALYTSLQDGIWEPIIVPPSYKTGGGSISKPLSLFAKISNGFYIKTGGTNQVFNMGVEYRVEKNNGIGKYNDNDLLPLNTSDTRPVAFKSYPALHQLSAYVEDNFTTKIAGMPFKIQAGLRFSSLQLWRSERVWSLSPRINVGLSPTDWLDVRFAYGKSDKTPGMTYIYPTPKYIDRIVANYNQGGERYIRYQTVVLNPNNSDLKNATNTRFEAGLDFKLPDDRKLSLTAYHDKNDRGFGGLSDYGSYPFHTYGVKRNDNNELVIDLNDIIKSDVVMTTKGSYGNTNGATNKGIEMNFELGRINPLRTNLYLRGAYMHSEQYSVGYNFSNPIGYSGDVQTPPFKMVYNAGLSKDIARMFSTQLQAVCNIPVIQLVASATLQVIWYNYTQTTNQTKVPIAYVTNTMQSHLVTSDMLADPEYRIEGILLKDQVIEPKVKDPTKQRPIWLLNARLTKNITDFIGVSFYANNVNYYEPWKASNLSPVKSQRNTGTFAFGLELKITM